MYVSLLFKDTDNCTLASSLVLLSEIQQWPWDGKSRECISGFLRLLGADESWAKILPNLVDVTQL